MLCLYLVYVLCLQYSTVYPSRGDTTAGCFASELVLVWPVVATTTSRTGWHVIKKWPGNSDIFWSQGSVGDLDVQLVFPCFPYVVNHPTSTKDRRLVVSFFRHSSICPGCEALGSMDRTWSRWNVGGKMCWWWKHLSEDCTSFYDAAQKNMYEYVNVQLFMLFSIFLMFFRVNGLDMCFIGFRQILRFRAQNSLTPSSNASPANFYPSGAADSCPLLATDSRISFCIVDVHFDTISFTVDPWYKQVSKGVVNSQVHVLPV